MVSEWQLAGRDAEWRRDDVTAVFSEADGFLDRNYCFDRISLLIDMPKYWVVAA